jgi:hypothetical protein
MRVVYVVLGICAVIVGMLSLFGIEMTPFAAGCYAITAGIAFISEGTKVK